MMKSLAGAALLFLLTLATGCATTPDPIIKTNTVYERPPKALYPSCDHTPGPIKTNGDLLRAYRDSLSTIQCYESGLDALRAWPGEDET